MFEVGFTELLLIFGLALIVLGPERLPKVASQVGRWLGRARAMARQFREQLEAEVDVVEPPPRRPAAPQPHIRPEPEAERFDTAETSEAPRPADATGPESPADSPPDAADTHPPHERGT